DDFHGAKHYTDLAGGDVSADPVTAPGPGSRVVAWLTPQSADGSWGDCMGTGKTPVSEHYALSLGCRVSVQAGIGTTRVTWSISHLSGDDRTRPPKGDQAVSFTCPRCRRTFGATVESRAKTRAKRLTYQLVGWLLLASLLATVPVVVHLGGQTVDEHDPGGTDQLAAFLLMAVVGFIGGLTFVGVGRAHAGVRKFRRIRTDGKPSVLAKGHRLF
ncbi:hypothetical protein ABZ885_38790, partial [Kitasatospora sp. NPDC047058]